MKLLERVNSRIVLLVGLAIIQASLVYDFCLRRNLEGFLIASSIIIILFATLYWIRWLVRHGVTNFEVCMVIGGGVIALNFWHDGNRILGIASACAGLFFAIILLRRLLLPVGIDQQEANLSAYRAEANSLSPIKRHSSALIAYAILGGVVWAINGFVFPRYANFLFILAIWDASMLTYNIVKSKRTKTTGNPAIESTNETGGRA